MFERFTEQARQVVVLAQEESRGLGHDQIGTEHMLLGLFGDEGGVAARTLARLDITADRVRDEIVCTVGRGDSQRRHVPFTPRAKRLLERALREALGLRHNYIGPEHILLAIAGFDDAFATRILVGFGAGRDEITQTVMGTLTGARGGPPHVAAAQMPDLSSISDGELDGLIDTLADEERIIADQRRMVRDRLEMLLAERERRRAPEGGA